MTIMHHGVLDTLNKPYQIKPLHTDDIPSLLLVQNLVLNQLDNKDTLQPLSKSEFEFILQGNGFMVGAFVEDELMAFRALLIPPINEEHLGLYLGLEDQLEKIIYQEISVVHPAYRGNQLQQKLAISVMDVLRQSDHDFTYVCATVAPHNIASLKDKFKQMMLIGALTNIYEGKLRYIFFKNIHHRIDEHKWSHIKTISISNIAEQKHLLQSGWLGFQLIENDKCFYIKYGKKE